MKKQASSTRRRRTKFIVLISLLAVCTILVLIRLGTRSSSETTQPAGEGYINYGPPGEDEITAGNNEKFSNEEEISQNDSDAATEKSVSVIITDAGQYDDVIEVRAFIPDYYQDGTCSITFTKDTLEVTKTTPAYKDVATTICTNPVFNRNEFTSTGEWQVVVDYKTTDAKGKSLPYKITIN